MMFLLNELLKDKVIFLKKLEKTFQSVGQVYFNPVKDEVRFKKHTYKIPKEPSRINKWGKRTFYLELLTGKQVIFKDSKISNSFTAAEMDMVLHQGIIRRFVRAFGAKNVDNWVMIIFALVAGVGMGIVVGLVIGGVI